MLFVPAIAVAIAVALEKTKEKRTKKQYLHLAWRREIVLSETEDEFFAQHMHANWGDLCTAVKTMMDKFQSMHKTTSNISSIGSWPVAFDYLYIFYLYMYGRHRSVVVKPRSLDQPTNADPLAVQMI